MRLELADPKGLMRESYRIEGITPAECRSIFIDWALSLPVDAAVPQALRSVIDAYAEKEPDHPMSAILQEGLSATPILRRRGGRTGRLAQPD